MVVTGLPAQAKVRADRVTANKFYGFANGVFYVSTNGTSFTATVSSGLPTSAKIVPVYNQANDVWLVSPDTTRAAYGTRPTAAPASPS